VSRLRTIAVSGAACASVFFLSVGVGAQISPATQPRVELRSAPLLKLSGDADSNSPALWDEINGRSRFFVMTSFDGRPSAANGPQLARLGPAAPVTIEPWPGGGVWMEAVVKDHTGRWYGFYHQENVATMCGSQRVIPRIGAVRSSDAGRTWEPLGTILEAPPGSHDCVSYNTYFVGGVGDLSVQLDPLSQDLYIFYSLYLRTPTQQGVGVARMAWADRDSPRGRVMVWRGRSWAPASVMLRPNDTVRVVYPVAAPLFPTTQGWHDDNWVADAFWGPSVHWNTHLGLYVMLLNRTKDETFKQDGIYISYAPRLDDPRLWSSPAKIMDGGKWYPQVIGLEQDGTDKQAGELARFFMSGSSSHFIRFIR
jgi:hypothetical protein